MMKWFLLILTVFLYSCASIETQDSISVYDYEDEEEAEFLASEDEESIDDEMKSFEEDSAVAQSEELEEKEAEDELKEIEDEFAEFADEELEYASGEPSVESEPQEEVTEPPSEVEEQIAENVDSVLPAEEESLETAQEQEPAEEKSLEMVQEQEPAEDVVAEVSEELAEDTEEPPSVEEEGVLESGVQEQEEIAQQEEATPLDVSDDANVQITNIRYENEQIHIDSSGGLLSYRSRFNEATRQFIIEIPNAVLVNNLRWPFIMKEFQSGFALLQADQKSENVVRIIIQMRPESPAPLIAETETGGFTVSSLAGVEDPTAHFASSETDLENNQQESIEIADKESTDEGAVLLEEESFSEEEKGENLLFQATTIYDFLLSEKKFYGKPITLDVRNADLKDILYFLAEDSGINMIISDQIRSAKVNIQLKEVPWDQALFLIMKQNDLAYIREGNVVNISSIQDFEARQTKLNAIKLQREASVPLKMEIIPIAYAQASIILSQINIFKTPRGNIQADAQNNSLIIRDTETALSKMKKLIADLDRTPKQVMISAKIVEAREDFSRNFGISWFLPGETISPSIPGISALNNIQINPSPLLHALPASPDTGTLGSHLSIGRFAGLGDLDVRLGFAENNGSARVLSSPRIMALNGEQASVNSSSESISFSAVIPEGGGGSETQIQRSPLSLSLSVTPEITNVDSVYMRVNVTRSSEGQRIASEGGNSASPISNRTASTRILVKSGQTAVIGGIYETRESENLQGIPFLKDIPVVSWLFSQVNKDKFRTELLLFLTPRIIDVEKGSSDVAVR